MNIEETSEKQIAETIHSIDWTSVSWNAVLSDLIAMATKFTFKLVAAIVVFMVGRWLIGRLNRIFQQLLDKRKTDPSIRSFVKSFVNISLTVLLILIVIDILGVKTTSLVALFASAGVAFGMALSGSLQNFAGGFMILLFKPYKVGDYIQALGAEGTVKEIQIFNTVLTTADNKVIYIPNGKLSTDTIVNYSHQKNRRVDLIFSISYGDDYDHAKDILHNIMDGDNRILKNPAPLVALYKLNDNSVDITVRPWVAKDNYWDVYFYLNETVYKKFTENGIDIPFPQLTVHMAKD
ncbi:MAG: mechanosensitive ion channel [Dysgonamonadaceae bacterium]|jgi:small conductance mechanosensitive channel|nr:mechanosensitive ion channel [Dysgonamonadaceae bacterium]